MCRYADHNYRYHYVCFGCRKAVKSRCDLPCSGCGAEMQWLGRGFAAPARTNDSKWRALEILVRAGYRFDSCGCDGPGYRPTSPGAITRLVEAGRRDPIRDALRRNDIRKLVRGRLTYEN